jgi:hypothetical protein
VYPRERSVSLRVSIFAAIGVLLVGCRPGQSAADFEAAQICRGDYGRARTAADTSAVDGRRPIISRGQASTALTCGAMRQARWLDAPPR